MHSKLQKASTHFTKFFSRRPLNAADTLMVLSTLALFTAIPNSSSSTSESVCIVQAFVTVSILFRVRTLCPILYFQYILQNSEIMFSDWQVSVSHSHLIFSHDLTIPEDLSAFYCLAESASRILRSLMKLWKHFLTWEVLTQTVTWRFSDQVWKASNKLSIVPAPNFFLLLNNTEINSKDYS